MSDYTKTLWARLGINILFTESEYEEIIDLFNRAWNADTATERDECDKEIRRILKKKIMHEQYEFNGDTYIPSTVFDDANIGYLSDYVISIGVRD